MPNPRLQLALDNWDTYVARLAAMSDGELEKKLAMVYLQSEIAERTKNTESLELLDIWQRQIIEARTYKAEHNIPDTPNEIELAIADIETTIAKSETRTEVVGKPIQPERSAKPRIPEEDSDQMSLF